MYWTLDAVDTYKVSPGGGSHLFLYPGCTPGPELGPTTTLPRAPPGCPRLLGYLIKHLCVCAQSLPSMPVDPAPSTRLEDKFPSSDTGTDTMSQHTTQHETLLETLGGKSIHSEHVENDFTPEGQANQ